MTPKLEILGVYHLDVTPEIFAAQFPKYDDEGQCMEHFSSVVLIEARSNTVWPRLLDDLTQPSPNPHAGSQAPWDEGLLSGDGETLLQRTINCVKGEGTVRFAFYMHCWNPHLPLTWTYGEIACPHRSRCPTV